MCLLLGVEFESIARKAWDLFTVRLQIAARSAVNKKRPTSDVRKFAEMKTHIGQGASSMQKIVVVRRRLTWKKEEDFLFYELWT